MATCIAARGIREGPWLGIKPTGQPVTFKGVNVDRVVEGRIAEPGGEAKLLGPLLDIGAIRVVAPQDG